MVFWKIKLSYITISQLKSMKITKDKLMNKVETLELVDKFQKTAQFMKGNLIYTITRANLMDMVELLN